MSVNIIQMLADVRVKVSVYSHFAGLLSADEQGGDAHQHDYEEHASADAFDHAAQRL